MGLARELTLGPNGGRRTRSPQPGSAPVYRTLRRLTALAAPTADDVAALRAAIDQVAASPARLRPAEGRIWSAACTRYRTLTGERIGPETAYL
jgi:hypothetical protein